LIRNWRNVINLIILYDLAYGKLVPYFESSFPCYTWASKLKGEGSGFQAFLAVGKLRKRIAMAC